MKLIQTKEKNTKSKVLSLFYIFKNLLTFYRKIKLLQADIVNYRTKFDQLKHQINEKVKII